MKITVLHDDGSEEIFQNVTDTYLAIRQLEPEMNLKTGEMSQVPSLKSYSWGNNLRELGKEVSWSCLELMYIMKERSK